MSTANTIKLLCTETDLKALEPVLAQLRAKGLAIAETPDKLDKKDLVLAVLSSAFYADADKTEKLLGLIGAGSQNVLPLQLDTENIPETLKNALYARNIIPADGRDAAHTADRIISALPKKKNNMPLIFGAAGLVLAAVIGISLLNKPQEAEETVVPEAEPQAEITVTYPGGITAEDLAEIKSLVIIGDKFAYQTNDQFRSDNYREWDQYTFAYDSWENDAVHWYSKDDGHEYTLTRYEDLSFIELMPRLVSLTLVYVDTDTDKLPKLSECRSLDNLYISDCTFTDLTWVSGAPITKLTMSRSNISDFSPLTACGELTDAYFRLEYQTAADLSSFSPPSLMRLELTDTRQLNEIDLDGLKKCTQLNALIMDDLPVGDLHFLVNAADLTELRILNCHALRDVSALGNLKKLKELNLEYCENLTDYTPIAGCTELRSVFFQCDYNPDAMQDASFLADLPLLTNIHLYSCNLNNLDFLEGISHHQKNISLGFAGDIGDYSGLSYIDRFEYLHVNPRNQNDNRGGEFSAVLPYLADANIDHLQLYSCRGIDLAALPDGIRRLYITGGDLQNLSGLKPYNLTELELRDCQYLTSLAGLENVGNLHDGSNTLLFRVYGSPRLTDYSALDGAELKELDLIGTYTLPDLGKFTMKNLRLESTADLADLTALDALSDVNPYETLALVGLDEIRDLSPLKRLKIRHLKVPPQVAEQAQELVDSGIADDFEVSYPDGSWQPLDNPVELLSLDELETLPKSVLKHIGSVSFVSDRLYDRGLYDTWDDWEHTDGSNNPGLLLHNRETDETESLTPGSITDLSVFSALTGLRDLCLIGQPLTTLDGIQQFSELESIQIEYCHDLTDISAVFSMQNLHSLNLHRTGITSIEGIRNLTELRWLSLSSTKIADLSPLEGCDFSAAYAEEGFGLSLGDTNVTDFTPLSSIERFRDLDLNGYPPALWLDAVVHADIYNLWCGYTDELDNETLTAITEQHPELERLNIPRCSNVTDLAPVLSLEHLASLRVSDDMESALASLEGQDYNFELEIEY